MTKFSKCPKCKAEIDLENALIIEQRFVTGVMGKMDADGNVTFEDDDLDGLAENIHECYEGKPSILGCEKCIGDSE